MTPKRFVSPYLCKVLCVYRSSCLFMCDLLLCTTTLFLNFIPTANKLSSTIWLHPFSEMETPFCVERKISISGKDGIVWYKKRFYSVKHVKCTINTVSNDCLYVGHFFVTQYYFWSVSKLQNNLPVSHGSIFSSKHKGSIFKKLAVIKYCKVLQSLSYIYGVVYWSSNKIRKGSIHDEGVWDLRLDGYWCGGCYGTGNMGEEDLTSLERRRAEIQKCW